MLCILLAGCATSNDRALEYDPSIPKDIYLERVQLELDAENEASQNEILNYAAVALIGLGSVALAFGSLVGVSKVGALSLIASGAICASLPRVFNSEYFPFLVVFAFLVATAGLSLYLWKWYRNKVDNNNTP